MSGITIYEGKRYREVERKARVGELVKVVDAKRFSSNYIDGEIITVEMVEQCPDGDATVMDSRNSHLWTCQYVVLEPIQAIHVARLDDESMQPTPSLEQRVTHLENMLRDVQQQLATNVSAQPVTVDEPTQRTYTRDEVVELAKTDVERLRVECFDLRFVENRAKRTVVALVYNTSGKVGLRGKAKACDVDCFNKWIGSAIALRRALRLDVPDYYVNAPQPTKAQVGDIVNYGSPCFNYVVTRVWNDSSIGLQTYPNGLAFPKWSFRPNSIIDDSHDFGGEEV